jgi:CheY-like chemotaxis protein/HPt (histidine-containing phosphotransfer) domain-containing protein
MMGGSFTVDSAPGQGSTFGFTVRCAHAVPGAGGVQTQAPKRAGRFAGRVLLVEDNVVNRKVARATLKGFGLEVAEAANGQLALDAVAGGHFDLILMDIHMPVMDGLCATRQIRTAEADGTLAGRRPIVALTANVMRDAVEACRAAGMDDFLPKPFERAQMIDVLARWLQARDAAEAQMPARAPDPERPMSASAGAAIDLEVYARLAKTMQDELPALLEDFVSSTADMLATFGDPATVQDRAVHARLAHTLKSGAAMIGATRLSSLARGLEAQVKAGKPDGFEPLHRELAAEFERVRDALARSAGPVLTGA